MEPQPCENCMKVIGHYFPHIESLAEFVDKYAPIKTWELKSPKSGKATRINHSFKCLVCGKGWMDGEAPQ